MSLDEQKVEEPHCAAQGSYLRGPSILKDVLPSTAPFQPLTLRSSLPLFLLSSCVIFAAILVKSAAIFGRIAIKVDQNYFWAFLLSNG